MNGVNNLIALRNLTLTSCNMLHNKLEKNGYKFIKNNRLLPGRPCISFETYKIAVYVDTPLNNLNSNWLRQKINKENELLTESGYLVLRFWDYDIINKFSTCILEIETAVAFRIYKINTKNISFKYLNPSMMDRCLKL